MSRSTILPVAMHGHYAIYKEWTVSALLWFIFDPSSIIDMWVPLGFVFMVQSQSASEDPLVPFYVRFHLPLDFDDHRAALFEYSITSVYIGTTWMGNRDDQLNRWLRLRRGGDVDLHLCFATSGRGCCACRLSPPSHICHQGRSQNKRASGSYVENNRF